MTWSLFSLMGAIQILSAAALFYLSLRAVIHRSRQTNQALSIACWIFAGISLVCSYSYMVELFVSYYSANKYEGDTIHLRIFSGPYVWAFWLAVLFQTILPQLLWPKYFHVRPVWPLVISGGSLLFSFF